MGGELAPNRQQRILCGAALQFVGFGEQDMDGHAGGDGPAQHLLIRVGQWVPNIHQHHQATQTFPVLQVAFQLLIPFFFDRQRHFGKTIARQVNEPLAVTEGEKIDELRAARGTRGPRQLPLLR